MAPPLNRNWFDQLVDDSGDGGSGTVWNKAQVDGLLDTVDASLAGLVDKSGTPAANQVASFADADTVKAEPTLLTTGGDLTITKADPRLVLVRGSDVQRGRLTMAVPTWAGITANGAFSGGWTLDDPTKDGMAAYVWGANKRFAVERLLVGGGSQELLRVDDVGVVLPTGQLQFPATQKPSADPTTLDDYREGPWTPTLTASGGASGQVYNAQIGRYVKIGRLVMLAACRLIVTTTGTLTGNLLIGGLPYPADVQHSAVTVSVAVGFTVMPLAYIAAGTQQINLDQKSGSSQTPLTSAQLSGAVDCVFSAVYLTTN